MKIFIHTVGTSILTNALKNLSIDIENPSRHLNEMTNLKESSDFDKIQEQLFNELKSLDISELDRKKCSAELNALYTYMEKNTLDKNHTVHYLIYTDTATGELASEYIKKMMNEDGYQNVELRRIGKLSTKDTSRFNDGIKNLFKLLNDELPSMRSKDTQIIFNLTGGFKSLQGYMNTAGMFYADAIIYIFESNADVIEIEKLPILVDESTVAPYAKEFLLAEVIGVVSSDILKHIAPIYKEVVDDMASLSPIGLLAWHFYKKDILTSKLLTFERLIYSDSFKDDFKDPDRDVVKLQETLAKVDYELGKSQGDVAAICGGGLQYSPYKGQNAHIGHFRITQETRVSCIASDGKLTLRHFGAHDKVNNNP